MFKNRCYNGGKKHNFKPRYDEQTHDKFEYVQTDRMSPDDIKRLLTLNVYVRDVCTWCGKPIEKKK